MKLNVILALELGQIVIDEIEYINFMVKDNNILNDNSTPKAKIHKEYKDIITKKYGKPVKYPCLVVNYNDEKNNTLTEFLYLIDVKNEKKEYSDKLKTLQKAEIRLTPKKKTINNSFKF
jgi:hypothetical protein